LAIKINTYKKLQYSAFAVVVIFTFSNCNNTFDPLQNDHPYAFSMYGYLDVHADTQYVRVMPILETLLPVSTQDYDFTVQLRRVSTGHTQELDYNLVQFGSNIFVRNYFSSDRLVPKEIYELISIDSAGVKSMASITLPDSLPPPEFDYNSTSEIGVFRGTHSPSDRLVYIEMYYKLAVYNMGGCEVKEVMFNHTGSELWRDGMYNIRVSHSLDLRRLASNHLVLHRRFRIVTAASSYPENTNLTPEELTLPHLNSNVSNGTGFIAGISSVVIDVSPELPTSCS
jgi:hypothetical protein